jgi:hypothetical protein
MDFSDSGTDPQDRSEEYSRSHRREERLEVDTGAKICTTLKNVAQARLVDISMFGCSLMTMSGKFNSGDTVWLKVEELQRWKGTVRWVRGDLVGVEFGQPFYPSILNRLSQSQEGVVCSLSA